jgi:hypothetical protein
MVIKIFTISEAEIMSCLNCYACEVGESHLPKTLGKVNEPIGSCINCQAFNCGFHGFRDRASRRFECIMCYPSLLAASAGAIAAIENSNLEKKVLYQLVIQHYPRKISQVELEFPYISSMEEFYERYPFYKAQLQTELKETKVDWNSDSIDITVRKTLMLFPDKAKQMLHAAGLLIKDKSKETQGHYPRILLQISKAIEPNDNGGTSNVWY